MKIFDFAFMRSDMTAETNTGKAALPVWTAPKRKDVLICLKF